MLKMILDLSISPILVHMVSAIESLPDKNLSDENHPSDECPSADHSNKVSCPYVAGPGLTVAAPDNTPSDLADTVPLNPHAAYTSPTDLDAITPIPLSEPSTSGFSALKSITKQAVSPVSTKHLVERLRTFSMPAKQTGEKRKRSLSSSVYALTSKRWKELCEAEEQEKSQILGKKKGK